MIGQLLMSMGILLIFIGIVLVFIANSMYSRKGRNDSGYEHAQYRQSDSRKQTNEKSAGKFARAEVRGGGIIMFGPIPIILGTDGKSTQILMLLAIVLMLVALIFFK